MTNPLDSFDMRTRFSGVRQWRRRAIVAASLLVAALMTILAKAGLKDVDPDFAQLLRTAIVLPALAALVLFTGKFPRGMFDYQVGVARWGCRVNAYMYGLVDKYPPFRLHE